MERQTMKPPLIQGSPDDFQTPAYALDILIPFIPKSWRIWECAEGEGNLTKALIEKGYKVVGSDILTGTDFLKDTNRIEIIDCIITNPPYSIKEKFIERCYAFHKPFALLLPLTALESEKRQKMFRENGIQLIIPNKRINFITPSKKGSGSWFASCWYVYGLNLDKDINFVQVEW